MRHLVFVPAGTPPIPWTGILALRARPCRGWTTIAEADGIPKGESRDPSFGAGKHRSKRLPLGKGEPRGHGADTPGGAVELLIPASGDEDRKVVTRLPALIKGQLC